MLKNSRTDVGGGGESKDCTLCTQQDVERSEEKASAAERVARDAVKAARLADERFAVCVENLLDCFGMFTAIRDGSGALLDLRIDYLNKAACENGALSLEGQLGRGLCELQQANRSSGLFDVYRKVIETGKPLSVESFEFRDTLDGETVRRWFDIRAFKLGDGMGMSWRDVTSRHMAEIELRQRDERLGLALRAGDLGIWEWQVATGEIYWSAQAAMQTIGVSEERTGHVKDFESLVHPDDRQLLWQKVDKALQGIEEYRHEFRIIKADGQVRWLSNAAIVVRDEAGKPVRVVGTVGDITERCETVRAVKKRMVALRATRKQLRQMAESIPNLVWSTDAEGRGTYASPQWITYVGGSAEDAAGDGWLNAVHPEDAARVSQEWSKASAAGSPFETKYRIRRHDGEYRWFHARAKPVRNNSGAITRWWGTCTDIHEEMESHETIKAARAAAEKANATKDRFLAGLSHELRSPLTPVITLTKLLLENKAVPEEMRTALSVIDRNVSLQVRLVDDLLDLTRIERGKLLIQRTVIDAHEHLRHALSISESDLRCKGIELQLMLDAENSYIDVDATRFEQVVWNIVTNAIKFTAERGKIRLRTFCEEGKFKFSLSDGGIGIDAALLPHIFDSFEQGGLDMTRRYGGLGLGLAICKQLVGLMDGEIVAESAGKGQGATFTVSFKSCEKSTVEARVAAPRGAAQHVGMRVLLVDDHDDARFALGRVLALEGMQVREAESVASALRIASVEVFDLVISDIGLPDGSGWDLMRRLAQEKQIAGIALSGFGMPEDVEKSRSSGFSEHLTKPISPGELRRAIDRIVGKRA